MKWWDKEAQPIYDAVEEGLQMAWNDYCAAAGCIPDAFEIHSPSTTQVSADFSKGNFALTATTAIAQALEKRGMGMGRAVHVNGETYDNLKDNSDD